MTHTPIPFFDPQIRIHAHTVGGACDQDAFCGASFALQDFIGAQPARLEVEEETNDFICTRADGAFVQGREVLPQ